MINPDDPGFIDRMQDEIKKAVKPIRCPICQCEVQVVPFKNKDGSIGYNTKMTRTSSLERCPRCKCGKKDVFEAETGAKLDDDS